MTKDDKEGTFTRRSNNAPRLPRQAEFLDVNLPEVLSAMTRVRAGHSGLIRKDGLREESMGGGKLSSLDHPPDPGHGFAGPVESQRRFRQN